MASRGLLKCPDEYYPLLVFMQDLGMEIELNKELLYHSMIMYSSDNQKIAEECKQDVIKLLHPDFKSPLQTLAEKAQDTFKQGSKLTTRIRADVTTTIKTANPLEDMTKAF